MSTSSYRDKVNRLEQEINQISTSLLSPTSFSTSTIVAVVAPAIIFIALYYVSPKFVTEEDDGKQETSTKKVILWTAILTAVTWVCIYGYNTYNSNAGGTMLLS